MTIFPVIVREVRAASRQRFTYLFRMLCAALMLVCSFLYALDGGFRVDAGGGGLFAELHMTLFSAIWIMVPLLVADCLSRERREGTLGLLFLTRLSGPEVVLAKAMAHALKVLSVCVAALPIMTLPFIFGGIRWAQVLCSLELNLGAVCWSLGAGLLASAWSSSW